MASGVLSVLSRADNCPVHGSIITRQTRLACKHVWMYIVIRTHDHGHSLCNCTACIQVVVCSIMYVHSWLMDWCWMHVARRCPKLENMVSMQCSNKWHRTLAMRYVTWHCTYIVILFLLTHSMLRVCPFTDQKLNQLWVTKALLYVVVTTYMDATVKCINTVGKLNCIPITLSLYTARWIYTFPIILYWWQ